jgi:hypothetical protein
MPIAWLRELLRRRRRVLIKPRTHELRVLGFEEMEERRMLALPPGITTSTFSAPWINMGPSVIATNPASGTLSGVTVNNGSVPESQGLGSPAPSDPVEGGVTAIAVDPANSNIGWVGTTNGGIFQTQNLQSTTGPTWVAQLDQNKALSIGSIYADPTDATGNTVVAGIAPESSYNTQDSDQSGVTGAGSATPVGSTVRGVYRSTNAASTAATWTLLTGFPQDSSHNYTSVVEQGAIILAADDGSLTGQSGTSGTTGGLYRSINNGSTAVTVSTGGTNQLPSGAVSSLVSGLTPNIVYAAVIGANAGIYGSNNEGAPGSWVKLSGTGATAIPITSADENIEIAVSKPGTGGTSATLYVGLVDGSGNMTGVYKGSISFLGTTPLTANASWASVGAPTTTDGGNTYGLMTTVTTNPGGAGTFLGITSFSIVADPNNGNLVYVGGDVQPGPYPNSVGAASPVGRLFVGNSSTGKWTSLTGTTAPAAYSHTMVFDTTGANLYEGDGGGIYKLQSPSTPGSWLSLIGAPNTAFNPLNFPSATVLTSIVNTEVTGVTDLPLTGGASTNPIVVGSAVNSGTFIQHNTQTSQYDTIEGGSGGVVETDSIFGYAPSASSVSLYTSNAGLQNLQRQSFGAGGQPAGSAVTLPLAVTGTTQNLYTYQAGIGLGYNSPLVTNNVMPGWLAIGTQYVFTSQDQGNTLQFSGTGGSPTTVNHVNAIVYGGISAGAATFYPISPVSPKANPYLLWVGSSGSSGSNLFVQLLNPATPLVNNQVPLGAQLTGISGVTGNVTAIAVDPNDDTVVFVGTAGGAVYQIVNTNPADTTWSDPSGIQAVQLTKGPGVGQITSMVYVPAVNSSGTDQLVVSGYTGVARASITAPNIWTNMSTSTTASASLPNTNVMSLYYDQQNDLLIAGTLGRGIYEIAGFAKSLGGVQLNVTGPGSVSGSNTLVMVRDAANPGQLDVYFNSPAEPGATFAYNTISKVVINLTTPVNNVILDFTYGDPLPSAANSFSYTALAGAQNTITVDDSGSFALTNSSLTINSLPQSLGNGVVSFPTAGIINNAVFNPPFTPYNITGIPTQPNPQLAPQGSTYSIGSGGTLWTGNAQLNGIAGVLPTPNTVIATTKNTSLQPVSLSDSGIQVLGGQFFGMQNIGVANLTAGAASTYTDVSRWSGIGSLNGLGTGALGYVNTPVGNTGGSTYFAYAQGFFDVYLGQTMNLLGYNALNLDGSGAINETFNNLGWVGTAVIRGGPGTNSLYTSPPATTAATPRNFALYTPVATPSLSLPGFVYDTLSGSASNYAAEYGGIGVAWANYVNGSAGSTFDVSNYSALTNGSPNGFGYVYINGNGANTTITDAAAGGNTNMVLTSSSLFTATNQATLATSGDSTQLPQAAVAPNTNTIAILIASIQNIVLNTVSGNNSIIAYSWGVGNGLSGNQMTLAAGTGQDTFYVGGPSGVLGAPSYTGNLDNINASTFVAGGGGSVLETNDYNYDAGTKNMYYDISGSAAGGGTMTPDGQTPRVFQAITWDSAVTNVIVDGAAATNPGNVGNPVVKYLMTPSSTSAFTIYGSPSSVNNFLGTFFYQTLVQQLYDETSPTTATLETQYIPNGDFWYWNFGNRQPIYFQNIGGVNGLGTLALGGGTAGSTTSTANVQIINPATGELGNSFPITNYPAGFQGGVSVASGNFTPNVKNSPDEIVTAPGPNTTSIVDIFSTAGKLLFNFQAYNNFLGGTNVAVGNVTNNGTGLDIITAPQTGVAPVEVWHVSNLTTTPTVKLVNSFYPYGTNFTGGVSVGAGDFNGDGYADVVTSPFTNLATQVNVYSGQVIASGASMGSSTGLINSFSAFTPTETGGSTVSVGDVNGDGVPDIVIGAGLNGQSQVAVMDGVGVASGATSIAELAGFQVFNSSSKNASGQSILLNAPLRIALADVNGSGRDVLFATQGAGGNANAIDIIYPLTGQRVVPDPGIVISNSSGGSSLG